MKTKLEGKQAQIQHITAVREIESEKKILKIKIIKKKERTGSEISDSCLKQ